MDRSMQIRRSWDANAHAWTHAVRDGAIASRVAGTNKAILDCVTSARPCRVLDVGCGEGWLAAELASNGFEVLGFDGSRELIERAKEHSGPHFLQIDYAHLARNPSLIVGPFERIVCNYSLFEQNITSLLKVLLSKLTPGGSLIIQTLHPANHLLPGEQYRSGWRIETFQSMGTGFHSSMPYYFRTFPTWCDELRHAGFVLARCNEPGQAEHGAPLSLILEAERDTRYGQPQVSSDGIQTIHQPKSSTDSDR
jgi:2-polyprenyl-3-methyl-5-hydroxy-6-metoxy-1,4-benzoquinol methylase